MNPEGTQADPMFAELISRYEKWHRLFAAAGKAVPNEPVQEDGRLNFRDGYPHQGWTAYIIEPKDGGYVVLRASTERRNEPAESHLAFFSRLEDAGKLVIWYVGEGLRMDCWLTPVTRVWQAEGLDPRVQKVQVSDQIARYSLKTDPGAYFEAYSGGIKPENHLLPLSYDELDSVLLEGMPESVTSAGPQ
jgi:hypothetical protein